MARPSPRATIITRRSAAQGGERLSARPQEGAEIERRPRPERSSGDDQQIGDQPIEPGDLRGRVVDGRARLRRQRDASPSRQIEPQLDRRQRVSHLVRHARHHPPERRQPFLPRQIAPHPLLDHARLLEPLRQRADPDGDVVQLPDLGSWNRRGQIIAERRQRPLQRRGGALDRDERIRRAGDQQQRGERQRDDQKPPALQCRRRAHGHRRPEQRAAQARRHTRDQLPSVDLGLEIGRVMFPAARAAVVRIASRQTGGTAAATSAGAAAPVATPPRNPTTVDTVAATPAGPSAASRSISSRTASRPRSSRCTRVTEMAR